jgi:hypothetical protein
MGGKEPTCKVADTKRNQHHLAQSSGTTAPSRKRDPAAESLMCHHSSSHKTLTRGVNSGNLAPGEAVSKPRVGAMSGESNPAPVAARSPAPQAARNSRTKSSAALKYDSLRIVFACPWRYAQSHHACANARTRLDCSSPSDHLQVQHMHVAYALCAVTVMFRVAAAKDLLQCA